MRLPPDSAPQPHVAILRIRPDYFANDLPGPEDVLLLIEVADTSLGYDRGTMLPLYAAAGIIEVWIANLNDACVEVYRRPEAGDYRDQRVFRRGDTVTPVALPDLEFPVEAMLG